MTSASASVFRGKFTAAPSPSRRFARAHVARTLLGVAPCGAISILPESSCYLPPRNCRGLSPLLPRQVLLVIARNEDEERDGGGAESVMRTRCSSFSRFLRSIRCCHLALSFPCLATSIRFDLETDRSVRAWLMLLHRGVNTAKTDTHTHTQRNVFAIKFDHGPALSRMRQRGRDGPINDPEKR